MGEGLGFLLGGGAEEVFGGAGALLAGAVLFSGAFEVVGAFDFADGVAAGFFDVEGAADFDGVFEGEADAVLDGVFDGASLGAPGRSEPRLVGEADRSAGCGGAAALRQQIRGAAGAHLVGGGGLAGGVGVAAGNQARGDGDRADGHGRRDAEEPGADRHGGLLPACAPASGSGPGRGFFSGGACGGSSVASHALCLPGTPDAVTTSLDFPVDLIQWHAERIRLIDFSVVIRHPSDTHPIE